MKLAVYWDNQSRLVDEHETLVIGRDPHVDISIQGKKVSRYHAQVFFSHGMWVIKDLSSSNGTYIDSQLIKEYIIEGDTTVSLGDLSENRLGFVLIRTQAVNPSSDDLGSVPADATGLFENFNVRPQSHAEEFDQRITLTNRFKIGRDATSDLCLNDLLVSRAHAEISSTPDGGHQLVDLDSSNGTFVNGQLVKRRVLSFDDIISIGATSMRYVKTALEPIDAAGGYVFSAHNITVEIDGHRLLDDVSFTAQPRSLTAIIGPSGAGKSTLLATLTGRRQAASGQINFAGRELHANLNELRNRIGLVPQTDLLHTRLTTKKALEYGAALRFPRDTTAQEREQRVTEVMGELAILQRADLRIDKLSGGQRKRTSVALELLTQPSLLFLDEPTSGLDPGLDRQLMMLFRELADNGRTLVVVTHSVANLEFCDNVLVLAPGGKVAYFGSPNAALNTFGAKDWAEVFDVLNNGQLPQIVTPQGATVTSQPRRKSESVSAVPMLPPIAQQSRLFQFQVLCKRYVDVIKSDKQFMTLMSVLPLLLAVVGFISGSSLGLAGNSSSSTQGLPPNPQARTLLLILILGTCFMGIACSIQELVKERTIYERERSIGLSNGAYLASKVCVLGVIVLVQTLVFAAITLAGRNQSDSYLIFGSSVVETLFTLSALALVSLLLGLAISARINTQEVAMPCLVVATVSQIVISGAVPLRYDHILDSVGWINPGYWAMNALASTIDLSVLTGMKLAICRLLKSFLVLKLH